MSNKHWEPLNELAKQQVHQHRELIWKTSGPREQISKVSRDQLISMGIIHPQQYVENATITAKWRFGPSGSRTESMVLEFEY